MILTLQNGYPFPFPDGLSEQEQEAISEQATGNTLELSGVIHFEWKYALTVEFKSAQAARHARRATGWKPYGPADTNILEAPFSAKDGYEAPAIIAGNAAYCGFMVTAK